MKELQNFKPLNNNKLLVILPLNKMEDYPLNECLYHISEQTFPIDLLILNKNLDDNNINLLKDILESPKITISEKDKDGNSKLKDLYATKAINYTIENSGSKTFAEAYNEAFNYALKNNYEWYSVIEYDDVVDRKWYENVINYSTSKNDIDAFLPLTKEISNGGFTGFINEACWVDGLTDTAGIFDLTLLLKFNCMNITGTVFKTESIKNFSEKIEELYKPIKESIKINYIYEFFLRMIYNDLKFTTIPRVGYDHRVDRPYNEVNYFSSKIPKDITKKSFELGGITMDEYNFWNKTVKKEYYFPKDRNIKYNPETTELKAV